MRNLPTAGELGVIDLDAFNSARETPEYGR